MIDKVVVDALGFCLFMQDGTDGWDHIGAVAETADGTGFVLAGYTYGDWEGDNAGNGDFAVVMLDVDGNESWRWQVR